uniref:Uncharacterized protein n=1 Tax=Rhizophora mucronata TaxID=61149 RepID=A0A2P2IQ88_RHIMU
MEVTSSSHGNILSINTRFWVHKFDPSLDSNVGPYALEHPFLICFFNSLMLFDIEVVGNSLTS